ncbi:MAG TPA: alpha/beta hydrolase [Longimicrobium sp.]|nr:alpha/beta hydrolase [Longimicrobium sp.]
MRVRPMLVAAAITALAAGATTSASAQAVGGLGEGVRQDTINGVRLWYRVAGRGPAGAPPVVFLHGGPGQGSVHFASLAGPAMERRVRMVYLDQRGSGLSERPTNRAYSLNLLVADIEGVREKLGVPRIVVVGHSFGAVLALEYAAHYPQRTAGVVIASGLWDAPTQTRLRCQSTVARFPEVARRIMGDSAATAGGGACDWGGKLPGAEREAMNNALMFPDSAVRIRMDSAQAASGQRNTGVLGAALFRQGLMRYRFAGARRLTIPVLVIAGRHDGTAVPEGLRALARELPNARFVEYENSGHFVYLDETERFARDVAAFVARSARR